MTKKDETKDDGVLMAGSDAKEIKIDSEEVISEAPEEDSKEDSKKEAPKGSKVSKPVSKSALAIKELREALVFLAFKTLEPSEFKEFKMRLPE